MIMTHFVADELREHGVGLTRGTSWKVVLRFIHGLRILSTFILFLRTVGKDYFNIAGRCRAHVLEEVPLYYGLYLVVSYITV